MKKRNKQYQYFLIIIFTSLIIILALILTKELININCNQFKDQTYEKDKCFQDEAITKLEIRFCGQIQGTYHYIYPQVSRASVM